MPRHLPTLLLLTACTSAAEITPGSYTLVGARVTIDQTMEAWAGPPVRLDVAANNVTLDVAGATTTLTPTPAARADWPAGCWTMQGSTPQAYWTLTCEADVDLGEGMTAACPLALIASCPDGQPLFIREVPTGDDGEGCGSSGVCFQFELE